VKTCYIILFGGHMHITPQNRYLSVSPVEEKQDKNELAIVLPTDYKKPENPYVLCKVTEVSTDSKFFKKISNGDTVVVERRMINKIEFGGKTSYLVLENYIYGSVK
jgi:co-chaperonin GroES (HSP10)